MLIETYLILKNHVSSRGQRIQTAPDDREADAFWILCPHDMQHTIIAHVHMLKLCRKLNSRGALMNLCFYKEFDRRERKELLIYGSSFKV